MRRLAIMAKHLDNSHMQVYVEGSSSQDGVSAAAVLYEGNCQIRELGYRLGDQGAHLVLEAELTVILLALQLVLVDTIIKKVTISSDS
jgi:hypothetical protein